MREILMTKPIEMILYFFLNVTVGVGVILIDKCDISCVSQPRCLAYVRSLCKVNIQSALHSGKAE